MVLCLNMRSIILAAGSATRFQGELKGLLWINNETILSRLVRQLKNAGVFPVYVVIGYHAQDFVVNAEGVSFIYDKDFESGKNSNSLKNTLDTIGYEDTLMLDADVVLSDDLISKLVENFKGESISLVDLDRYDDESMKLVIENNKIIKYSKDEGVGSEICSIVSRDQLKEIYKDLVSGKYQWWGVGPNTTGFRFVDVNHNSKWIDIDTKEEYEQAKKLFNEI